MGHTTASSGIQVLDRAVLILHRVAESSPTLAELAEGTGLPRATAHRLATALLTHRLLARSPEGRFTLGPGFAELAPASTDLLVSAAAHVLPALLSAIGESVQLYRLTGMTRTCIAALEPASGLRNTVPVGARWPLTAGSAAKVLLAGAAPATVREMLADAAFEADDVARAAQRGWAESVSEREPGLASVSAAIHAGDQIVAALSVSGPIERLGPSPFATWGRELLEAAAQLEARL